MNEYRSISAELQHNFHILPHFNPSVAMLKRTLQLGGG